MLHLTYIIIAIILISTSVITITTQKHPLLVLFAILIGATLLGLPGALIAVPCASALQFLAQEFYLRPLNAIATTDGATNTSQTVSGESTESPKIS